MRQDSWGFEPRLLLLGAIFLGCALILLTRLYVFQVVEHDRYRTLAQQEHSKRIPIVPRRGDILDRAGHPLAVSVMYQGVLAVGDQIRDREGTAEALAPILGLSVQQVIDRIDPESNQLLPIESPVPSAVGAEIEALRLPGIVLQQVPHRTYPEGSLGAQTLGFVGMDFHGLSGLELSLDEELAGQPGYIETERDTTGEEIVLARRLSVPPTDGADVITTIDRYIQRLAERLLEEALEANKSQSGVIVVMEPSTGHVLAAASRPTYRLTDELIYDPATPELYRPTFATDIYEPGSVMKSVTLAAGIDEGVITPDTRYHDTGVVRVGGATLRNWDGNANGDITMTEVLVRSSNVGTQHVSGLLGPERFYQFVDRFGFGQPTGIQLPGEAPGIVRSYGAPGWEPVDLATNSYGQGIAVTPLQMLSAISAIANGGVLVKPTIVKELQSNGGISQTMSSTTRRVISERTAAQVTEMMIAVMEQPAHRHHNIPGYAIAAKTGTSDFATESGYTSGKTYASVVAFAPAHQPRFSVLIRVDAPERLYGGVVAVPILEELAAELFRYLRIPADPAYLRSGQA